MSNKITEADLERVYNDIISMSNGRVYTITEIDNVLSGYYDYRLTPLMRIQLKNKLIAAGKLIDRPIETVIKFSSLAMSGNDYLDFLKDTKIMREENNGQHKLTQVATFDRIDEEGNAIFKF